MCGHDGTSTTMAVASPSCWRRAVGPHIASSVTSSRYCCRRCWVMRRSRSAPATTPWTPPRSWTAWEHVIMDGKLGLILGLCPANERWRYFVTTPLIGWRKPCKLFWCQLQCTLYITYNTVICKLGLILGLCPANERWRYFVTTPLIGWRKPCKLFWCQLQCTLYITYNTVILLCITHERHPISRP